MKHPVIYLWSHGRRPVRTVSVVGLADRQDMIPAGWCGKCGGEVYRQGRNRCERCRGGTGRGIYGLCESL